MAVKQEYRFTTMDLARILNELNTDLLAEQRILTGFWNNWHDYLSSDCPKDVRAFRRQVADLQQYLLSSRDEIAELEQVDEQMQEVGNSLDLDLYDSYWSMDHLLQKTFVRLIFGELKSGQARFKVRTLLGSYGRKKRSNQLVNHFNEARHAYHLVTMYEGRHCDIWELSLDDFITLELSPTGKKRLREAQQHN